MSRLGGGITNRNFVVQDGARKAVVRIGDDIPVHQIMRFNELAASRAAERAGVSPAVMHHEPGALVIDFVEGRTLTAADLQDRSIAPAGACAGGPCASDIPQYLRGAGADVLGVSCRCATMPAPCAMGLSGISRCLPELLDEAVRLEVGGRARLTWSLATTICCPPISSHDGTRLWLIDWDYAGFNSPLFDLGGLAANNGLSAAEEGWMLAGYFGRDPDAAAVVPLPCDEGGGGAARNACGRWCQRSTRHWISTLRPIRRPILPPIARHWTPSRT